MEGTMLILRQPTHAMMDILLDLLVGWQELARTQESGMGHLNTAIVNILVFLFLYQFLLSL